MANLLSNIKPEYLQFDNYQHRWDQKARPLGLVPSAEHSKAQQKERSCRKRITKNLEITIMYKFK